MRILSTKLVGGLFAALLSIGAMAASSAQASGLIILEGSDAQTYHLLEPYSTNFQAGLQQYSSAPTLKVLQVGAQTSGSAPAGTDFVSSLVGVDLMAYSGLYIGSPYGCCDENNAAVSDPSVQAAILAFHNAGRSIAIENYQGGAAFEFLLGFTLGASDVIGYNTPGGGESCFDGNQITAAGTVFGLGSGPLPNIGCFGHQAYSISFMNAHGFAYNLADNPSYPGYTVVASNGGGGIIEHLGVPEPATWAMMIMGFGLVGAAVRRRAWIATAA